MIITLIDFFLNVIQVLILVLSTLVLAYGIYRIVTDFVTGCRINKFLKNEAPTLARLLDNADEILQTWQDAEVLKDLPQDQLPFYLRDDDEVSSGEYTENVSHSSSAAAAHPADPDN